MTVEFLIEMDKLVQLIESPIFACESKLRLIVILQLKLNKNNNEIDQYCSITIEFGFTKHCRGSIFIARSVWYVDVVATNRSIHVAKESLAMHSTCSGIPTQSVGSLNHILYNIIMIL